MAPPPLPISRANRVLAFHRRVQHGLVTRAQALAAGLSSSHLDDLVRSGRWERWERGVYAPAGLPRTFEAVLTAAELRLGGRAVAIGPTAARLWRLPDCQDVTSVEVAITARTVPRLRGDVTVRSYGWLESARTARIGRHRVLGPDETIADLARVWPVERLLVAAADQWRRGRGEGPAGLARAVGVRGRYRGASRARQVLAELDECYARTRSVAEILAVRHLRASELPMPMVNHRFTVARGARYEFDLTWPDERAIVEIDGIQHVGAEQRSRDERRDADTAAGGWSLLRVPAALTNDRERFLDTVAAHLADGRRRDRRADPDGSVGTP